MVSLYKEVDLEVIQFLVSTLISILTIISTAIITLLITKYSNQKQFDNQLIILKHQLEKEKKLSAKELKFKIIVAAIDGMIERSVFFEKSLLNLTKKTNKLIIEDDLAEKSKILKNIKKELLLLDEEIPKFTVSINKLIILKQEDIAQLRHSFHKCIQPYTEYVTELSALVEAWDNKEQENKKIEKMNKLAEEIRLEIIDFQQKLISIVDDILYEF